MTRRVGAVLLCALFACGGSSKQQNTTPTGKGSASQSMNDKDPVGDGTVSGVGGTPANAATNPGDLTPAADGSAPPPIAFPNQDPDPQQAKVQVDAHLTVAKAKLSQKPPDADGALAEAKEALKIDAASVDAAAYVAFAYYHKKLYDTSELVLDDLFKRDSAKQNANVYYVYGLVYDHTNRPEQAVLAYKKAVELNPSFTSALVNLGVHQLENKQYAEAESVFERLVNSGRADAVTLTSLGSAYRGHSADYPPGSGDRNQLIMKAEAAYKRATAADANYGPAYFDLSLLYLDSDPFPSGGGNLDSMQRLTAAKTYLDQYKNMPGVDIKLYDQRMKDVDKAIKREQKKRDKATKQKKGGK